MTKAQHARVVEDEPLRIAGSLKEICITKNLESNIIRQTAVQMYSTVSSDLAIGAIAANQIGRN